MKIKDFQDTVCDEKSQTREVNFCVLIIKYNFYLNAYQIRMIKQLAIPENAGFVKSLVSHNVADCAVTRCSLLALSEFY